MSINNIKKNLSPKARIVLFLVSVVTAGSAWIMYSVFSSDETDIPAAAQGAVAIDNTNATTKDRGDKPKLLPEGSDTQNKIEELKQKEIDEKKKTSSFIAGVELQNDAKVLDEIEKDLSERQVETGIDDVVDDKMKERQARAQDLLDKKRRAEEEKQENKNQNSKNTSGGGSSRSGYIPQPFNEDEFMNQEVSRLESKGKQIEIFAGSFDIPDAGVMGSGQAGMPENSKNTQGASASSSGQMELTGEQTNYANFIRNPKDYPKADIGTLEKYRAMARRQVGNNSEEVPTASAQSYDSVVYPTNAPQVAVEQKILPGDMFYAILEIEVDTDELSPVRATIVQEGPLKGGVMVGMPSRTGAKSMIKFDNLSLNGESYSGINVVAVDPNTMRTALADDVDYHTFERYFKLATASVVAGYAETLKEVEDKETATGSTTKTVRGPDEFGERVAVAVGRVGEKLEPKFEAAFDRPPTVTVYKNRDLGIMFMKELVINKQNK